MFKVLLQLLVFSLAVSHTLAGSCRKGADTSRKRTVTLDDFAVPWNGDNVLSGLDGCADNDEFTVSVVVYNHLWIQFDPTTSAGEECVPYLFNSMVVDDGTGSFFSVGSLARRDAVPWNATAELTAAFTNGYVMGNITTLELIEAVEIFDGEYGGDYDIITNSCAAKIIDVLTYLNFNVSNPVFLDWIATKLQTDFIYSLIRNASSVTEMYPGLTRDQILAKPNEELVSHLTYWSANETLALYGESLNFYRAQAAAPRAPPRAAPSAKAPTMAAGSPQASGKAASTASALLVSAVGLVASVLLVLVA